MPSSKTQIDMLIKSFMRPKITLECISAIRKLYNYRILVADDSKSLKVSDLSQFDNVELCELEYDVGLSAGRNYLISKSDAPYFVLLDNDFMIVQPNTIENLYAIMSETDAAISSGMLWDVGQPEPRGFVGYFTNRKGFPIINFYDKSELHYMKIEGIRYAGCRFCENFFLAKREYWDRHNITWDEALKHQEHEDFFLRFPESLRITFSPDIWVEHKACYENEHNADQEEYIKYRYGKRQGHYREMVAKRYGIPFDLEKHKSGAFFPIYGNMTYDWTDWKFPNPFVIQKPKKKPKKNPKKKSAKKKAGTKML